MANHPDNLSHEKPVRETILRDQRIDRFKRKLKAKREHIAYIGHGMAETCRNPLKSLSLILPSANQDPFDGNVELRIDASDLYCRKEDLINLLAGTGISVLFVDRHLHLLCFSPSIAQFFKFKPHDIGQPLGSLLAGFDYCESLVAVVQTVLDTRKPQESELEIEPDSWQLLRIAPFSILNNSIEGAAVTFIDIGERKRLEEKLRRSEARLRAIVETASYGIITIDQQGLICSFNAAAESIFGYSEAEICGRNISELMPHPYRCQHDNYIAYYLKTGKSRILGKIPELYGQRKGGAVFPMSLSIGEFFDGDERFFTGIIQDITDRQKTEMALRKSEERFAYAIEAGNEGIWDWDIVKGQATHNQKWFELLGLKGDDSHYSTRFMTTLLHEDDHGAVLNRIQKALDGDGNYRSEHRLRRTDGQYIWVREQGVVVKRDYQGKPLRMVGSFADITEQKKADRALQESEERFRSIFEQAGVGVAITESSTGCFLRVNKKYLDIVGLTIDEMRAITFSEITHPDDLQEDFSNREKLKQGLITEFSMEKRLLHKNGCFVWVFLTVSTLRIDDSDIEQYISIVTDISSRKRMEQQLREHQHDYERLLKLEVASQTATAIAHELNQPLNAAASYTHAALLYLRADNPKPELLAQALSESAQQIQRGGRVIHELCRFLRDEEAIIETLDLNELLAKMIMNLKNDSYFGKFRVKTEFAPGLPAVRANGIQIEKVVNNLLRNGVEAMRKAGLQKGTLFLQVCRSDQGEFAQITVRDLGPGLNQEVMQHLFQPFFTTKSKGLGIGLALSRAMIEAQGGKLWFEHGAWPTTFHLTLPFTKEVIP